MFLRHGDDDESFRREVAGGKLSAVEQSRRRHSGGGRKGRPGSETSVGQDDASGEVNLGNAVVDRQRHGEFCSLSTMAGGGWKRRMSRASSAWVL